ncbi:MAG: vWA domain-containing protein [Gammaproteobacteria bacterium]
MRRRRAIEVFSLSFLDCICCGFGAVILFYVIISARSGITSTERMENLTSETASLQQELVTGRENLLRLRNTVDKTNAENATAAQELFHLSADLEVTKRELSAYDATSLARRERIEQLKTDVKSMEDGKRRLEAGAIDKGPPGQDIKAFRGAGDRRYITGIKMHGKHILVLVDHSASMMHEDLVTIIRMRNLDTEQRKAAAKWRRAVDTVDWLLSQLPPGSSFQIIAFNTTAAPLLASSNGKWIDSGDAKSIALSLEAMHNLVPENGTSLVNAFTAARNFIPRADQIILITDGLPTQGKSEGFGKYITAARRARLFDDSIGSLPDGVPIDTILLPLKGEPQAEHRFWELARLTHGSLFMPSRDWP